jgi:CHAT domain-containing protein
MCRVLKVLLVLMLIHTAVAAQCPDKKQIWNRILFLRDSSSVPPSDQLKELEAFRGNMEKCGLANDSVYALLLQRTGTIYFLRGETSSAVKQTLAAIDFINQRLTTKAVNPGQLVKYYYNLAVYYDSLAQPLNKYAALDSCIAWSLRTSSGYNYSLSALYQNQDVLFESGDYHRCISYAELAERISENMEEKFNSFFINKINALLFLEEYDKVQQLLSDQSNKIDDLNTIDKGSLYAEWGRLYAAKGNNTAALDYYRKAVRQYKISKFTKGQAEVLVNTGYLYFTNLHQNQNALKYFREALQIADDVEALNILGNIAGLYTQQHEFDSAFLFFQRAFDKLQPGITESSLLNHSAQLLNNKVTEYVTGLILDKADAYVLKYNVTHDPSSIKSAIKIYQAADRLFDEVRVGHTEFESRLFWRAHTRRLYQHAIKACYLDHNIESAFYFFEKSRAVLLSEQLSEQEFLSADDMLKQSQLKQEILLLERRLDQTSTSSPVYASLQTSLFSARQQLDAFLFRKKNNSVKSPSTISDTTALSINDVRGKLLSDHLGLMEIFVGDSAVYTMWISKDNTVFRQIDKQLYDSTSRRFFSYVTNAGKTNQEFNSFLETAHQLYKLVFDGNDIPEGRVIISPDGYYFPFEALVKSYHGKNPEYFVEDHAISYTYSAKYLCNHHAEPGNDGRQFMGIAPVKFAADFHLPTLQGSEKSLGRIKKYFDDADNLVAGNACRKNFMSAFADYEIIQLYTHAADKNRFGEPVIYFSDSALLLSDLIGDKKPSSKLIVLSACETGTGKLYQGEGVFSFSRGFASLGIPSSITNLWQVDNESTYQLTELFYKYLSEGLPIDVALQRAKKDLIRTASDERKLPAYWAGATLSGRTEAIINNQKAFLSGSAIAAIVSMVIISGLLFLRIRKKNQQQPFIHKKSIPAS